MVDSLVIDSLNTGDLLSKDELICIITFCDILYLARKCFTNLHFLQLMGSKRDSKRDNNISDIYIRAKKKRVDTFVSQNKKGINFVCD